MRLVAALLLLAACQTGTTSREEPAPLRPAPPLVARVGGQEVRAELPLEVRRDPARYRARVDDMAFQVAVMQDAARAGQTLTPAQLEAAIAEMPPEVAARIRA